MLVKELGRGIKEVTGDCSENYGLEQRLMLIDAICSLLLIQMRKESGDLILLYK